MFCVRWETLGSGSIHDGSYLLLSSAHSVNSNDCTGAFILMPFHLPLQLAITGGHYFRWLPYLARPSIVVKNGSITHSIQASHSKFLRPVEINAEEYEKCKKYELRPKNGTKKVVLWAIIRGMRVRVVDVVLVVVIVVEWCCLGRWC